MQNKSAKMTVASGALVGLVLNDLHTDITKLELLSSNGALPVTVRLELKRSRAALDRIIRELDDASQRLQREGALPDED